LGSTDDDLIGGNLPLLVGYHASHEQFEPSELLRLIEKAERAGFKRAMCSDHLAPFSLRQGSAGLALAWLGAALAKTRLSFGFVNAPGQRYHPAIVAQGLATLADIFPSRLWVALGSGQYINERVTGTGWPSKSERNERLQESAEVIRRLLRGERVTHDGRVRVEDARLYVVPASPPPILGAAVTTETAAFLPQWADGMITVYQPGNALHEVIRAFRENGGVGKRMILQAQHSYAPDDAAALTGALDQWRFACLDSREITDAPSPEAIDAASAEVQDEQVLERVRVSSDFAHHVEWLREYEALGFDEVYVHNVNRDQEGFIAAFAQYILPLWNEPGQEEAS
jgi:coenzyme F420-dependent glucose-6-phosphate dehydrogenase